MEEPFAGEYHSDKLGVTYTLVVEKGNLFFRHRTAPKAPLDSTCEDTFSIHNIEIGFTRNDQNQVSGFILNSGRAKNLRFTKQSDNLSGKQP